MARWSSAWGICARHYSARSAHASTSLPKPRLDYREISENVVSKSHNAFNRKARLPVGAIQSIERLYNRRKEVSHLLNTRRHAQAVTGERIRQAGKDRGARNAALQEAKELKSEISQLERDLALVDDQLFSLALAIPNDTHPRTPLGSESSASLLCRYGSELIPASPLRDHVTVCRDLGLLDLEAGATVTGSSWYYLLHEAALLEMALTNYGLSIAIKHGFTPVITPDVVRADMYHLSGDSSSSSHPHPELVLSGTAEIPLAGMFANQILPLEVLPRKVVGLGRAFRAEAGARGAETRGLYRVHQFTKLELFARNLMDEMRRLQQEIFLACVLDMPTEELGASAYRKIDMEAWMPGRGSWGEISSLSNCTDYQARRLHIRHRPAPAPPPSPSPTTLPFAHTLNGTAIAVPRLIIALLENGARLNDSGQVVGINLPVALKPYWPYMYDREIARFSGRDIVQWVRTPYTSCLGID
ncbi:seryl-tRNA synthetase [Lactarius quietus]|nr:seryl-tRNA synthetase [Lactarius quietus]